MLKVAGKVALALLALLLVVAVVPVFHVFWLRSFRVRYYPHLPDEATLGGIADRHASIWVRAPGAEKRRALVQMEDSKQIIGSCELNFSNRWTDTINITNLHPSTTYKVVVSIVEENVLVKEFNLTFTTFPEDGAPVHFSFNYGSCIEPTPWESLEVLKGWAKDNSSFALFLGDTIYTDVFGNVHPAQAYAQLWADPHFMTLLKTKPQFFMYDDHEIHNDYDEGPNTEVYKQAIDYWRQFAGLRNPLPSRNGVHYFSFQHGNVGFFVLDTRAYRSPNIRESNKTLLGAVQKQDLMDWLRKRSDLMFKFIVSPVPFLRTEFPDGWAAYLDERQELIQFISKNRIPGVVILSADTHWPAVVDLTDEGWLFEHCSSPIYALPLHPGWGFLEHMVHGNFLQFLEQSDNSGQKLYFSDGLKLFYGNVEVNTKTKDKRGPYYQYTVYSYYFYWQRPTPAYTIRRYFKETIPKKVRITNTTEIPTRWEL